MTDTAPDPTTLITDEMVLVAHSMLSERKGVRAVLEAIAPDIVKAERASWSTPATDEEADAARDAAALFGVGRALDKFVEKRLGITKAVHEWFYYDRLRADCCRKCGIVRHADDANSPCKGDVRVGPRDTAIRARGAL